jgi:hypothetical protein
MQELLQHGEDGVEQKRRREEKEEKKEVETLGSSIGNVTSASLGRTRHGHTEEYGFLGCTSKLFAIRRDESHSLRYCNLAWVKIARLKC